MTYSPPAELVERIVLMLREQPFGDDGRALLAREILAASGLGKVVEVLRKALSLVDDYKVVTDAEKAIAEEVRALLARLDTRT